LGLNRKILYGIVVLAVVVGAAVWFMLPKEEERLEFVENKTLYGWASEQKLCLHIINRGGTTAELHTVEVIGWGNWSFYRDVIIPPGVECLVEFSMWGGPVSVTTASGSPPAEGGDIASPNWSGNMTTGSTVFMKFYTRKKVYAWQAWVEVW